MQIAYPITGQLRRLLIWFFLAICSHGLYHSESEGNIDMVQLIQDESQPDDEDDEQARDRQYVFDLDDDEDGDDQF